MKKYLSIGLVVMAIVLIATSYVLADKQYIKNEDLKPFVSSSSKSKSPEFIAIDSSKLPEAQQTIGPTTEPSYNSNKIEDSQELDNDSLEDLDEDDGLGSYEYESETETHNSNPNLNTHEHIHISGNYFSQN